MTERAFRFWVGAWAVLLSSGPAILALLLWQPALDYAIRIPTEHFYIVSLTAFAAVVLAALVSTVSFELRDARVFFLALAFLTMAAIFLAHGLGTPGVIVHAPHKGVALSARLSLLLSSACFALSAVELPSGLQRFLAPRLGLLWGVVLLCLIGYGVIAVLFPHELLAWVPLDAWWLNWGTPVLTISLLLTAAWRYWQVYHLSRLPLSGTLVAGFILLAEAQVSMAFGRLWQLSWWEYHVLMLIGFLIPIVALIQEYLRSGDLRLIIESLFLRDSLARIQRGYPEAIHALAEAVEAKEHYTRGHTERVAALAVAIGQELKLPPGRLRTLAQGALLHDVGKIGTPDAVLLKPGPLTAEEFAVMREHARRGWHILSQIPSLREAAAIARWHHERIDGSGYPDGLQGEAIPLEARIAAVADIYDALTSDRPYRAAWTREQALAEIRRQRGSKLDARCVDALINVIERQTPPPVAELARASGAPEPPAKQPTTAV